MTSAGNLNESQTAFLNLATGLDCPYVIYREYKPRNDTIEFTVYFKIDETRHRLDFDENAVVFTDLDPVAAEWYIVGRTVQAILQYIEDES